MSNDCGFAALLIYLPGLTGDRPFRQPGRGGTEHSWDFFDSTPIARSLAPSSQFGGRVWVYLAGYSSKKVRKRRRKVALYSRCLAASFWAR